MITDAPSLFSDATNTTAFLKCGIMGHTGSGKSRTASELLLGLVEHCRKLGLEYAQRPVYFFDTETGSDWLLPIFKRRGWQLKVRKSRDFKTLVAGVREAEQHASAMLIDSVTHVWREYCEAFLHSTGRTRLDGPDWDVLKRGWGRFTDLFVNSRLHIAVCGRAGYEYDHQEKDDGSGQLELVKVGMKMKAETEFGYEPSLLVLMERESDPQNMKRIRRVAYVLKDRSDTIDGKAFVVADTHEPEKCVPTFDAFRPHVDFLNLGGEHIGVDTTSTSDGEFNDQGDSRWHQRRQQLRICLEEIDAEFQKQWPSQSAVDKAARADAIEKYFGTRSWTKVESMKLEDLQQARMRIWLDLRGHAYGQKPSSTPNGEPTTTDDAGRPAPAEATKPGSDPRQGTERQIDVRGAVTWRNVRGFPPPAKVGDRWEHEDGSIDECLSVEGGVCSWAMVKPERTPFDCPVAEAQDRGAAAVAGPPSLSKGKRRVPRAINHVPVDTERSKLIDELVAAAAAVGKDEAELRAFAGEVLPLKSHPASLQELTTAQLVNVRAAIATVMERRE